MKYLLIPVYLVLTILGLVFMKQGGNPGTVTFADGSFSISMSTISAIGFVCYIGSFFLFTRLVVMFDLSYIYPLTAGITQVVTLIISYFVFHEKMSINGIVGAILVIIGIIVMNLKFNQNDVNSAKNNNIKTEIATNVENRI